MTDHATQRQAHPRAQLRARRISSVLLITATLAACGGHGVVADVKSGATALVNGSASSDPIPSLSVLIGKAPPARFESACDVFKVTTEGQLAANLAHLDQTLQQDAPTVSQARRQSLAGQIRQSGQSQHLRGFALSSCSTQETDDAVFISHLTSPAYARAKVAQRYSEPADQIYDDPNKPWEVMPGAQVLGGDSRCLMRRDSYTVGGAQSEDLREVCLVAMGSYVLGVSGQARGDSNNPPSSPGVVQQAALVKAWLAAGAT